MDGPRLLLALSASFVAMMFAAKTHGRQVRLEREHAGHLDVTFGARNDPFVEALWRRDRWRFWPTLAAALALIAALAVAVDLGGAARPRVLANDPSFGLSLLALPLWAMTLAFVLTGARSALDLRRAFATRRPEPHMRRAAGMESALWWAATGLASVAALALSW